MTLEYNPNLNRLFQDNYRQKLKSSYTKLNRGNISFCTLYNISSASTFNEHLDSYYENIGDNSPLKFIKIENYPLFNVQELSLGINWEMEKGLRGDDITIEATIAPFSIRPTVGSFIKLEFDNNECLFKYESESTESNLDSDMNRKITMKLSKFTQSEINKQALTTQFFIFDKDITVEENKMSLLESLKEKTLFSLSTLVKNYYNWDERYLLDPELTPIMSEFIKGMDVFGLDLSTLRERYLQDIYNTISFKKLIVLLKLEFLDNEPYIDINDSLKAFLGDDYMKLSSRSTWNVGSKSFRELLKNELDVEIIRKQPLDDNEEEPEESPVEDFEEYQFEFGFFINQAPNHTLLALATKYLDLPSDFYIYLLTNTIQKDSYLDEVIEIHSLLKLLSQYYTISCNMDAYMRTFKITGSI